MVWLSLVKHKPETKGDRNEIDLVKPAHVVHGLSVRVQRSGIATRHAGKETDESCLYASHVLDSGTG